MHNVLHGLDKDLTDDVSAGAVCVGGIFYVFFMLLRLTFGEGWGIMWGRKTRENRKKRVGERRAHFAVQLVDWAF